MNRASMIASIGLACGVSSLLVVGLGVGIARGDASPTRITLWRSGTASVGGMEYGGWRDSSSDDRTIAGYVTQVDELDVPASGEVAISGLADRLDPSTLQVRSTTDAAGTQVVGLRYARGVRTPDEALARAIGKQIVVTTSTGDITGILRAVDLSTLAIEQGEGTARAITVLRRAGNVLRVALPAGDGASSSPTVRAMIKATRPGRQSIETSYLVPGMSWSPAYTAIVDAKGAYDFDAAAVIVNDTQTVFPAAALTLVAGPISGGAATPSTFGLPATVALGAQEQLKVDLSAPLRGLRGTEVVVYESIAERYLTGPSVPTACYGFLSGTSSTRAVIELAAPGVGKLPDGTVRVMQRTDHGLSVLTVGDLDASGDVLRLPSATPSKITGVRTQTECRLDEPSRTMREKIKVTVDNPTPTPAEVLVREPMARAPAWRIDAEDKPGVRGGDRIQEYRVNVAPKTKQVITYTVVYSW